LPAQAHRASRPPSDLEVTRRPPRNFPGGLRVKAAFTNSPRNRQPEYNPQLQTKGGTLTQKIIEVVGTSTESFAKASEAAVKEAAKTVRNMKWAHIDSLDMMLDGGKVVQYRSTTKIYFDVEG
jgi:flavin-binding protein dodecin